MGHIKGKLISLSENYTKGLGKFVDPSNVCCLTYDFFFNFLFSDQYKFWNILLLLEQGFGVRCRNLIKVCFFKLIRSSLFGHPLCI